MKNYSKIMLGLLLIPVVFLSSCENGFLGCVEGNGRIATEHRYIGEFENIVSYGSFVVEVDIAETPGLVIETDENLMPYIKTSIQGNTLILETRNDKCIRSRDPIVIYVDATTIERLKISGSGIINCDGIVSEDLDLEVSGSGNITCRYIDINHLRANVPGSGIIELSGSSGTCDYTISGSGVIKGINLETSICYASIPGSGLIYTTVFDKLDVTISGSGFLYYDGTPTITTNITGSGNVREYR